MQLIKDLGMIEYGTKGYKKRYGLYLCPICEEEFTTSTVDVKRGKSTQCRSCSKTTHNKSKSNLYDIYRSMLNRCCNKNNKDYKDYGERGIIICNEWLNDFKTFYNWAIENGYEEHLTIDRKNNNGNYESENCRWVSMNIQNRNTRKLCKSNTSGYRGVSYHKKSKKWRAQIVVNSKQLNLGTFDYPYTAAIAYDSYVLVNNLEHTRNIECI